VIGLLTAALFINYIDRGALSTALQLIQDELGFSVSQLGILLSAFFWLYSVLQIPVGWLAERVGAQRVLAAGLAIWACATMLTGFAHSFAALFALRLLLGVGESAGFPCVSKLLAAVVPVKDLGTANGVVAFGYLIGPAVGAYCGGLIMIHYGWRASFWTFGALSLLWLLPWSQLRLPRQATATAAGEGPTFGEVLRQPSLWGTALGLFSSNYSFYFFLTWMPYYVVRERGFSIAEMATLTGLAYLVNALSALGAGLIIDQFVRAGRTTVAYKSVMGTAHVGYVISMLVIAYGSQSWAVGGILAFQVLQGAASAGCFTMPQILAGPTASARWVGIQNCCGNFAGVIAPAVTGYLADRTGHFAAAFVVAAVVSVLGFAGWVLMVPKLAPLKWRAAAAVG
jgi:MFS family permease